MPIVNESSSLLEIFMKKPQKSNKRSTVGTITRETKREGQRKVKRHTTCKNQTCMTPSFENNAEY